MTKREERKKKYRVWKGGGKKVSSKRLEVIVRRESVEGRSGGGALGREMERGSWRYLTFKNLSNSLEYAARVRLASYLNGIALR